MRTVMLRQSGGSVIVSLPKAAIEKLGLGPDMAVEVDVEGDRIVIRRQRRGRIGIAARLAMCDLSKPALPEESHWLNASEVGEEWGAAPEERKP